MTHDPSAPASGDEATLYCPVCEYNLTGLIENRCPECGRAFDSEALRRRLEEAREGGEAPWPEPLSTAGVIAWMVAHLVIGWVVLGLALWAAMEAVAVIFLIGFIVSIIAAVNTTRIVVRGVAMDRAIRKGDASRWRAIYRSMLGWSACVLFVLLFVQWIVPACLLYAYMMSL